MSRKTSPVAGATVQSVAPRHQILMCPPDFYGVEYVINPWMDGNIHREVATRARRQWRGLHSVLSELADVKLVDPQKGVPDLVFTANAGLVMGDRAILSHFRHPERQREEPHFRAWFEKNGFKVTEMPRGTHFEGAGDALFLRDSPYLFMGYGFRTVLEAANVINEVLQVEVVPLGLVDERFYHLDTCFCPLGGGHLIYYPKAFDERSRAEIERRVPAGKRHAVGERDALNFACNAVDTGAAIVLNDATPELESVLKGWGFEVVRTPLDQFLLAGGAAKCLTLRLNEPRPAAASRKAPAAPILSRRIEFRGHILDNGTLSRVMDVIPNAGGTYRVVEFAPGVKKDDESRIVMEVSAPAEKVLQGLFLQLLAMGGNVKEERLSPAQVIVADQDGVAPENFYSTTIYPTEVLVDGGWRRVEKQRMDAVVVLSDGRAVCRLIRDIRKGDRIIVGSDGIRIHISREAGEDQNEFKFMGSAVSSERRVEAAVDVIAWEMDRIRQRGGRIVWVAGPVVIHTGGGPHLEKLVRGGYVSALLGGNAIAVHDLEHAVYGTSLGVDLARGVPVGGGHRHHITVINMIRRAGSIARAVETGVVKSGLFHQLVKSKIPFCLAGSIRDDGPLPDTVMDLVRAQEEYARLLEGAEMIVMLSSMLHSIGVGNMTPAGVKIISVDINPAVATKLADRGSTDSTPIVTDVGLFLNILARKLEDMRA